MVVTGSRNSPRPGSNRLRRLCKELRTSYYQEKVAQATTAKEWGRILRWRNGPMDDRPSVINVAGATLTDMRISLRTWHGKPSTRLRSSTLQLQTTPDPDSHHTSRTPLLNHHQTRSSEMLSSAHPQTLPAQTESRSLFSNTSGMTSLPSRWLYARQSSPLVSFPAPLSERRWSLSRNREETRVRTKAGAPSRFCQSLAKASNAWSLAA